MFSVIVYSVSVGTDILATVDGSTVSFTAPANFNGSETFTATVTDGEYFSSQTFTVTVNAVNDAPVLAGADVSMAPGTAIDMAQNAADIVFMGDKLCPTYEAYNIAKKSQSLVKQNFTLAVLYNLIAIPLAFAGMVTPMVAALAMSGSSLLVIANSFRLKLMS